MYLIKAKAMGSMFPIIYPRITLGRVGSGRGRMNN